MLITPKTIKDVVADNDDFGHEMRVCEIIRSIPDIESTHGGTYIDSITMKPRQFDFRCTLRRDERSIRLAIECKNLSKQSPVVICGTARSSEDAFHQVIESRWGLFVEGTRVVYDGCYSITRNVINSVIYPEAEFVGKAIIKIRPIKNNKEDITGYTTEPDKDIYERWTQALSSAYDLCKTATGFAQELKKRHFFTATIPVVVISDESLWTINYDADGVVRSDPSKADDCRFFIDRRLELTGWEANEKFSISHIHFCTLSGLKSWMSSFQNDEYWTGWLPPTSLSEWKK